MRYGEGEPLTVVTQPASAQCGLELGQPGFGISLQLLSWLLFY